jgi:haloalkane dehalogenase
MVRRVGTDIQPGRMVQAATARELAEEVVAAYDAPFPTPEHKAGARAFPGLIPQTPDDPATPANQRAWEVLTMWAKPFLCAYSDGDPITRGADKPFLERVPGTIGQPHTVIEGGGHFLQEDRGPELAGVIVSWLRRLEVL